MPDGFSAQPGTLPVQTTTPWWLALHDPILTRLIERARAANPDLGRAQAAVAEARAALAQAEAGGSPQLNAGGSGLYGRPATAAYGSTPLGTGSSGFDSSWEIDLWGKRRHTVDAATANAQFVTAEAGDALLTLLGDVARTYVELRGTQAQIATTRVALDNQRRANGLAARRLAGGDGSRLEILQGETLALQQQAQLPLFEAQLRVQVDALSTLCGEPPTALAATLLPPGPIPQAPAPAAGIPADLLRRRPDLRAAERQLAAATSLVGAAIADKYPTVSLSGTLSFSASSLVGVLAQPLFGLGPSLNIPLLDGGQRAAAADIRRAQADQAAFAYRTAVLKALREVEDAIARLQAETRRRDQLKQVIATAQQTVATASDLYGAGATDFLQVLDAQRALNQARDALAQSEAARTIQTIALFKALGGGWEVPSVRTAGR